MLQSRDIRRRWRAQRQPGAGVERHSQYMKSIAAVAAVFVLFVSCTDEAPEPRPDPEPAPEATSAVPTPVATATLPTSAPATSPPGPTRSEAIVVTSPLPGTEVADRLQVTGRANVFEATVSYRLVDAAGQELESGFTTATCGSGCWGNYSFVINLAQIPITARTDATLEVFESSAEDGSPLHVVAVPLVLLP